MTCAYRPVTGRRWPAVGLSMLARYEPATWGTLISVDNSQQRSPG